MSEHSEDRNLFSLAKDGVVPPETYVLRDAYYRTFEKIIGAETPHHTLREVSAVESVADKSHFGIGKAHRVIQRVIAETGENFYGFMALPEEINTATPACTEFTAAHEIGHAVLMEQAREGSKNSSYYFQKLTQPIKSMDAHLGMLKFHAGTTSALEEQPCESLSDHIELAQAYAYNGIQGACALISGVTMAGVSYVLEPLRMIVSRQEEYTCDAFALRAYPDMDLNQRYRDLSGKELPSENVKEPTLMDNVNSLADNFIDNVGQVCSFAHNTHPTPEQRHDRLVKQQTAMRAGQKS